MNRQQALKTIALGTLLATTLPLSNSLPAQALTSEQVNDKAFQVSTLIVGKQGHGSGVLVSQQGDTYHVLTACHVVQSGQGQIEDGLKLVTAVDKKAHKITQAECIPQSDLATVTFKSSKSYNLATIASGQHLKVGSPVFISGWPAPGTVTQNQRVRQFTGGQVSSFLDQSVYGGYKIVYTNITRGGMSGGPVFDADARLVGIHGLGDSEDPQRVGARLKVPPQEAAQLAGLIKPGFNYGIPVNLFLSHSSGQMSLKVDNSPPSGLQGELVAEAKPSGRDKIKNVNNVLKEVSELKKNLCGFLPFC